MNKSQKSYFEWQKELNELLVSNKINGFDSSSIKEKKKIGEGGFGKVILGNYKSLQIAVKKIKKNDPKPIFTELVILKKYQHPMIPVFYGIVKHPEFYENLVNYHAKILQEIHNPKKRSKSDFVKQIFPDFDICLEYINGFTLEYMIRARKLNEIEKYIIMLNLATVLDYIHGFNLIHRDIKPQNLMIDSKYEFKILDFGISKIVNEDKETNTVSIGTLMYMAPENFDLLTTVVDSEESCDSTESLEQDQQTLNNDSVKFRGDSNISNKVDIWAFGCILHQLFTGIRPWMNKVNNDKKIMALLYSKIPFEIDKRLDKDSKIRKLIKRCVEVDPTLRANITEVKAILLELFYEKIKSLLEIKLENNNLAEMTLKLYSLFPNLNIEEKHHIIIKIQAYIFEHFKNLNVGNKGIPRFLHDYIKKNNRRRSIVGILNKLVLKEIDEYVDKEKKDKALQLQKEKEELEKKKKSLEKTKLRKNGKPLLKVTWHPDTYFIDKDELRLKSPKHDISIITIDNRKLAINKKPSIDKKHVDESSLNNTNQVKKIEFHEEMNSVFNILSLNFRKLHELQFSNSNTQQESSTNDNMKSNNNHNEVFNILDIIGNEIKKEFNTIRTKIEKVTIKEPQNNILENRQSPIIKSPDPIESNTITKQISKPHLIPNSYMKKVINRMKQTKLKGKEEETKQIDTNIESYKSNDIHNLISNIIKNNDISINYYNDTEIVDRKVFKKENINEKQQNIYNNSKITKEIEVKDNSINGNVFNNKKNNDSLININEGLKLKYTKEELKKVLEINILLDKCYTHRFINFVDQKSKLISKINRLNNFKSIEVSKTNGDIITSEKKKKTLPEISSYFMKHRITKESEYSNVAISNLKPNSKFSNKELGNSIKKVMNDLESETIDIIPPLNQSKPNYNRWSPVQKRIIYPKIIKIMTNSEILKTNNLEGASEESLIRVNSELNKIINEQPNKEEINTKIKNRNFNNSKLKSKLNDLIHSTQPGGIEFFNKPNLPQIINSRNLIENRKSFNSYLEKNSNKIFNLKKFTNVNRIISINNHKDLDVKNSRNKNSNLNVESSLHYLSVDSRKTKVDNKNPLISLKNIFSIQQLIR